MIGTKIKYDFQGKKFSGTVKDSILVEVNNGSATKYLVKEESGIIHQIYPEYITHIEDVEKKPQEVIIRGYTDYQKSSMGNVDGEYNEEK